MLTDYLGNEIKEGTEICIISTKEWETTHRQTEVNVEKNYTCHSTTSEAFPCFKVSEPYIVYKSITGELSIKDQHFNANGGYSIERPLNYESMWGLDKNMGHLLAIKGLSDTEEQYNEYFKAK